MSQPRLVLPVLSVIAASAACPPAFAACATPPDVLPIAQPKAEAASIARLGQTPDGTAWAISGIINRCTEGDTLFAELRTPPEIGVTVKASVQLAITGVTVRFGNEAIENNPTEWRLTGPATIGVVDKANQDPKDNRLRISWTGSFLNLTDYQLSYTIFLIQK